jgi:hypothetical protein
MTASRLSRFTRPGGRLLIADLAPVPYFRGRDPRPDTPEADPMGDLATTAGYQVESWGKLPLLRYIVAVRPHASRG